MRKIIASLRLDTWWLGGTTFLFHSARSPNVHWIDLAEIRLADGSCVQTPQKINANDNEQNRVGEL